MRGALTARGEWIAPATWSVRRGRTLTLERTSADAELDAVLIPGLVNAHAHLDLAGADPIPAAADFPAWLLAVGAARKRETDPRRSARGQAQSLAAAGVVAVGDIDATRGAATRGRLDAGLSGRSFMEIVGVQRDSARAGLASALDRVDRQGGSRRLGLSPHAPYSVHFSVLPEVTRAARRRGLALAMHLAESRAETRYLTHGDGPFVEFLEQIGRGVPFDAAPGLRPIAYARAAGVLGARTLVVHGNDLDDDDIGKLLASGASVVYCHGTHSHFSRPRHRFLDLRTAGVGLALGTDSGASNQGVDLWREMQRFAADRPDVDPRFIIEAGTLGGRRALGLSPGCAHWERGTAADAVLLGNVTADIEQANGAEVAAWVLSGEARLHATLHSGSSRPVHGSSPTQLDTLLGRG